MISVEDACKTTVCTSCGSNDNAKEIFIGSNQNDIYDKVFALCKGCLAALSWEIDRALV